MSEPRIHYAKPRAGDEQTIIITRCGLINGATQRTLDIAAVTCQSCLKYATEE